MKPRGGGHSTLGYAPCATKKTLLFFFRFHRKTPIFTNFHPMTPYFLKILTFLTKCWEIFGHESPYFWCISLKDPLFWRNLSPKDPYIRVAWWHSYHFHMWVPPPPGNWSSNWKILFHMCGTYNCNYLKHTFRSFSFQLNRFSVKYRFPFISMISFHNFAFFTVKSLYSVTQRSVSQENA